MILTVGMIAALGVLWLGMPLGAAIVLGAVLAPTDPVLASDVQVGDARDTDRVRFTLTGEAGMNDGSAFPMVMLGLGLLGMHELGVGGWRWWVADVAWATAGGLACGAVLGMAVGRLVVHLRRSHHEAVGLDDFPALGLIASSYGLALLLHAYGFLAVFAAGLALRSVERELSGNDAPVDVKAAAGTSEELASHPEHAPAYMAEAVLHFNEQLERVAELTLVLLLGSLLVSIAIPFQTVTFAVVLLGLIRPLAAAPLALAFGMDRFQTALVSWFGIRGIGSLYYLFYAVNRGMPDDLSKPLINIVLCSIALSMVAHGVTVSPLMQRYQQRRERLR